MWATESRCTPLPLRSRYSQKTMALVYSHCSAAIVMLLSTGCHTLCPCWWVDDGQPDTRRPFSPRHFQYAASPAAARHPHIWDPASSCGQRNPKTQPAESGPGDPVLTSRIQSRDRSSRNSRGTHRFPGWSPPHILHIPPAQRQNHPPETRQSPPFGPHRLRSSQPFPSTGTGNGDHL